MTAPSQDKNTCRIYLIRHGATNFNNARPAILQGCRLNPALSEEGRLQAEQAGTMLADVPLTTVYSSPLLRAMETAECVAATHGLNVMPHEELTEVDVGRWEGLTWPTIMERHPEEYQAFIHDAGRFPYLGGENLTDVHLRATPFLRSLLEKHQGESIAVAGHNIVNRVFLLDVMERPFGEFRSIPQDNAAINVVRRKNGKDKVVTINSILHLG